MIIFSDNFNRANSTSLGTTWNEWRADPAGDWQILSNQLRGPSTAFTMFDPHCAETTTTAHAAIADCQVSVTRVAGTSFDGGPLLRKASGADTYYYIDFSGTNTWQLYRRVASVDTAVGSAITSASANGDIMGLYASGSTFKLFKNGTQIGSNISDSGITAAGGTGIALWSGAADLDDFSVDNLLSIIIDQEGFRFRNDDGSESTATFAAAQDTNLSVAQNIPKRLRILLNATSDPASKAFQLEYKKVGDTVWRKVE